MGKVYESDVDPDEFIRSFSQNPSGLPKPEKAESPPDGVKEKKTPAKREAVRQDSGTDADADTAFLERYVRNMAHMRPQGKYLMVEICPEYIRRIKRILSYAAGPSCSVKAYVNNVLSEHFREYGETIKKML